MLPRYSLFRRLVSLQLAVLVLLASVGLTVQHYTCHLSGRRSVAVLVAGQAGFQGCAGEPRASTQVAKDGCCDIKSHLHKLDAPAHKLAGKVLVPAPVWMSTNVGLAWPAVARVPVAQGQGQRWYAADSSPPPLGGRGLLAYACTLLV